MNRVLSLWRYSKSEDAVPSTAVQRQHVPCPTPHVSIPQNMNGIFQQIDYGMIPHSNRNVVYTEPPIKRRKVYQATMHVNMDTNMSSNSLTTGHDQSVPFMGLNCGISTTAPSFIAQETGTNQNPVLYQLPPNISGTMPTNHSSIQSQSAMVENSVPPLNPTVTAIPEDMRSLYGGANDRNLNASLSMEISSNFCDDESMNK